MAQATSVDAFRLLKSITDGETLLGSSRLEANARVRFTVAQALAQGRLGFHYQPVVRAGNPRVSGLLRDAGADAAAERADPFGGRLPADQVEDGPLGRAIDRLALEHALQRAGGRTRRCGCR